MPGLTQHTSISRLPSGCQQASLASNVPTPLAHRERLRTRLDGSFDLRGIEFTCSEYWDMEMAMVASGGQTLCILHAYNVRKSPPVAERLGCSPPTKANRVRSPAGSLRIFASGNRAGRCLLSAGFLRDLQFPPPLHSGAVPYTPHFTLIGFQDLAVKIHSKLFTLTQFSCTHVVPQHQAQQRTDSFTPTPIVYTHYAMLIFSFAICLYITGDHHFGHYLVCSAVQMCLRKCEYPWSVNRAKIGSDTNYEEPSYRYVTRPPSWISLAFTPDHLTLGIDFDPEDL
ncbi:hypothetical protein PR048_011914 [Dryococelus australis]|uniref:Uncharacterized protein n=1 Tax=Dryococelus australis TaxID=614101 RepID=A0ABQ9HN02_9NEOP|nr:hypothetical protein PR048_011914 [Dryococelus australis]